MFDLVDRVLRKVREAQFNREARAVLETPPVRAQDDGVVLFSMIGTRVLLPYLVAAKSLHARLGRGRFVILDDGTLTAEDCAVLRRHLDDPEIRSIADVDTGACPRGGTWERLLTILDLRRDAFVIQLDSDTVTLGAVPEIEQAIAQGRSFTLRGGLESMLLPLAQVSELAMAAAKPGRQHVQAAIEQAIGQVEIPGRHSLLYTRGCSGFAGFAPGGDGRALAEQFSREAERLIGRSHWEEWGSEQVTSNFVIANEPGALLLPYDRYLNFWNEPFGDEAALAHFVGTYRFHRGAYAVAARQAIAALADGPGTPA
jgi:hypothetical protein